MEKANVLNHHFISVFREGTDTYSLERNIVGQSTFTIQAKMIRKLLKHMKDFFPVGPLCNAIEISSVPND